MSDLQALIRAITAPARRIAGTARSLQKQAPGARMVGEFSVKAGLKEIGRRIGRDRNAP